MYGYYGKYKPITRSHFQPNYPRNNDSTTTNSGNSNRSTESAFTYYKNITEMLEELCDLSRANSKRLCALSRDIADLRSGKMVQAGSTDSSIQELCSAKEKPRRRLEEVPIKRYNLNGGSSIDEITLPLQTSYVNGEDTTTCHLSSHSEK